MFTLSITICPFSISDILNIAYKIDDFPAPVLPIIPILFLFGISKLMPFKINGVLYLYLSSTYSNFTSPTEGQFYTHSRC